MTNEDLIALSVNVGALQSQVALLQNQMLQISQRVAALESQLSLVPRIQALEKAANIASPAPVNPTPLTV